MKRFSATGLCVFVVLGLLAATAAAQGLLVVENTRERVPLPRPRVRPRPTPPPMSYKIKELGVEARITDQIARVQVSQSFVNTGSRQMEVSFVFPLPYDGAVDRLTFLVDGKEYPAKLLSAEEARRIYEQHIRRNEDPALLEWMGTGMFKTSIFPVPPGAERKVTLRYAQLLRKDHNLTDFLFPLGTAKYTSKPVEKVSIKASIESAIEIKNVFSPTHSVKVKRPNDNRATVSYESKNKVPTSDFRLFYSVAKGNVGTGLISYRPEKNKDGFFLLLTSPKIKAKGEEQPRKTVVCVFDRSGSMSGKKIEQAREALRSVVNNLREGDLFNILAYDSEIESFRPELQRYNDKTRKEALGFVEGLYAGGSTNINGALTTALEMLQDLSRPNYIIFMTDGRPTAGETNEAKIVMKAKTANKVRARMISFGVGYDVNSRLLDRLSRANYGQSEFVRPNEDIEEQVARLYKKISSPVLGDVTVKFEFDSVKTEEGSPITRMYPKQVTDLFAGEQLVIVGRYKKSGVAKVRITGKIGDKQQKYTFPVEFTARSKDQSYSFVEKLWAMRRIGEIIDEMDLNGKNDELVKELVKLSTKHGILTPYTSFLADEDASVGDLAASATAAEPMARKAGGLLNRLAETEGRAAFSAREAKKQLLEAQLAGSAEADGAMAGAKLRNLDKDEDVAVGAVQVVGSQVLYKRGNTWYSFDVARKEDTGKATADVKVVKRFSKEYFDLVRKAGPAARRTLAADAFAAPAEAAAAEEPAAPAGMMLDVGGQTYHVK